MIITSQLLFCEAGGPAEHLRGRCRQAQLGRPCSSNTFSRELETKPLGSRADQQQAPVLSAAHMFVSYKIQVC